MIDISDLEIYDTDWPDTHLEPDGFQDCYVPELTSDNLEFLAKRHNELVKALESILVKE